MAYIIMKHRSSTVKGHMIILM